MKDNIFKLKKYDELAEEEEREIKEELEKYQENAKLCRIDEPDCEACQ